MVDWWFDLEGRIGRIEMDIGLFGKPEITFYGDVDARFSERKIFRTGVSNVFVTEDGHQICVNDVRFRGERYVSLYIDRRLIKEYNVRAEKYKERYMRSPELFDSKGCFVRRAVLYSLLCAMFAAFALLMPLTFFNVMPSIGMVFVFAGVLWLLLSAGFVAVACFAYWAVRGKMAKYAVISSLKKRRKRPFGRGRKKKKPFIRLH